MKLVPAWLGDYRRAWLAPDLIAGIIVWSVVVPQAVAYAQIAGLPPEAGLMAAPGAMIAYAFLGSSRTLIVSAITATSALSASAVGVLAHGDTARFAALSATLALVTAVVLAAGGLLGLGALSEFVSKPVMGGFLFGLGLTIMVGQAPKLLGVPEGSGEFFERVGDLVGVLPGLLVAAGLSLILVIQRFSRPTVAAMVRDPKTNRWGNADRNPDWEPQPGALVVGSEGPLFYANSVSVKDHIHALVRARDPAPAVVVFEMSESPDLDVGTLDMLGELAAAQGSTTASASSRPSPTPPANRRACQP